MTEKEIQEEKDLLVKIDKKLFENIEKHVETDDLDYVNFQLSLYELLLYYTNSFEEFVDIAKSVYKEYKEEIQS